MLDTHVVDKTSYTVSEFMRDGKMRKKYFFPNGEHILTSPIELDSFDIVEGESRNGSLVKVVGAFAGPFIKTKDLKRCCTETPWFFDDGVPVRFSIRNLTIDLAGWTPVGDTYEFQYGTLSHCAVGLYGKSYDLNGVTIINSPGSGLISIGPNRGGKRDFYLDSPEARIDGLEVINTQDHGMVFAGPHDSLLDNIIVSMSKNKGVFIVGDTRINGACDIGFIHAYATDDIAIDVQAKVKARFLQGDTGKKAGVAIGNNNKSIIEVIEAYKTRASYVPGDAPSHSIIVTAIETQIGIARIRADAGAHGLYLAGSGNVISNLHICAGGAHSGFKELPLPPTAITLNGHANTIVYARLMDVSVQPIVVEKQGLEKYFTGNFSIDLSQLPENEKVFCTADFLNSHITVNNKVIE